MQSKIQNPKSKIGIIGLGKVVKDIHLPACAMVDRAQVVAGCEPDSARRAEMAPLMGQATLYADAAEMLERERPDIVLIATPPHTHRDLCLLALEHGAHVLCEKPFVQSAPEADEIIEAAKRHRRTVAVNNQYRHMPIYREARRAVESGEFGRPFLIQVWQQMFHPPSEERNWRAALVRSTLFEFGTHPLDLVCSFFDALPASVTAHTLDEGMKADVVVQVTLRFPGDRLATILLNRVSRAPERYLEMRVDCTEASLRISFGGLARASLDWSRKLGRPVLRASLVKGGETRVESGGRSRVLVRQKQEGRPLGTAAILQDLIVSDQRDEWSVVHAQHARGLIRVVEAAYESADRGQTIHLRGEAPFPFGGLGIGGEGGHAP